MSRLNQTKNKMSSKPIPPKTRLSYTPSSSGSSRSVSLASSVSPSSSASRSRDSPDEVCSAGKRREVSRADIKDFNPEPGDLWDFGGKFPNVEDLQKILYNATTGYDAIPIIRAKFRENSKAADKEELLSRILVYPRSRQMLLDFLIDYRTKPGGTKILRGTETLSDFYIQFCKNGPVFPGDAPESKELQNAAMIQYVESTPQKKIKTEEVIKIPRHLYELVQQSFYDLDNPDEKSPDRIAAVYSLLKLLPRMDVAQIEGLVKSVKLK